MYASVLLYSFSEVKEREARESEDNEYSGNPKVHALMSVCAHIH